MVLVDYLKAVGPLEFKLVAPILEDYFYDHPESILMPKSEEL